MSTASERYCKLLSPPIVYKCQPHLREEEEKHTKRRRGRGEEKKERKRTGEDAQTRKSNYLLPAISPP